MEVIGSILRKNRWANYELNNLALLANYLHGMGSADFSKYFSLLKFNTKSFNKLHFYVEEVIGNSLVLLSEESMKHQLEEEEKLSVNHFNLVLNDPKFKTKTPNCC